MCDKIDTSTQIFRYATFAYPSFGFVSQPSYELEYSISPNTPNINSATCEDADGPWTPITNNFVPSNVAESVAKVRLKNIVGGIPPNTLSIFNVNTLLKLDVISGSTVYNYGSFKPEVNGIYGP